MRKWLPLLTALICTLSTAVFASDWPLPLSPPNRISQGYGEWNLWGDANRAALAAAQPPALRATTWYSVAVEYNPSGQMADMGKIDKAIEKAAGAKSSGSAVTREDAHFGGLLTRGLVRFSGGEASPGMDAYDRRPRRLVFDWGRFWTVMLERLKQ